MYLEYSCVWHNYKLASITYMSGQVVTILSPWHSQNDQHLQNEYLGCNKIFAYTDFFLICLDIIGRVKISEYNFLCPFVSQGFPFFFRF
jgi:hypothetical protein